MAAIIDLHIHTTASDGTDTPAQLLAAVKAAGIRVFSVTDHDTIDGALEMEQLVEGDLVYVRGVEFSCVSGAGKCHILGYGYDPEHPAFRAALEDGRQLRLEKLERRLVHLREKFGIVLTEEEEAWLRSRRSPGKPHLGRILVRRELAADISTAIRTYLSGVPGRDRIDAKTAIDAINASGGVSVWAHPLGGEGEKRLTTEQFDALLALLLEYGIRGMECRYSRYHAEEIDQLLATARSRRLVVTGGSDYHGTVKKDIHLGQLSADFASWEIENFEDYGIICK